MTRVACGLVPHARYLRVSSERGGMSSACGPYGDERARCIQSHFVRELARAAAFAFGGTGTCVHAWARTRGPGEWARTRGLTPRLVGESFANLCKRGCNRAMRVGEGGE
jgi:hypothetical protein